MSNPMSGSLSFQANVQNDETSDQKTPEITKANPTSSPGEWTAQTAERGYYRRDGCFIKRSLRPSEYITTQRGTIHTPQMGQERLQNEAESLRFIRRVSNVPVPTVYGAFEVDGFYLLITEYIEGVGMSQLPEHQKKTVCVELDRHLATLRSINSNTIGGPSSIMILPYRVMRSTLKEDWSLRSSEGRDYVFCHNDLSQHNIIVDPNTLKINAIIDWEYAGFFPPYFEAPFYKRIGPSVALDGEEDDVPKLLEFLRANPVQ